MKEYSYPLNSLPQEYGEMISWLQEVSRFSKVEDFVQAECRSNSMVFHLYTHDYRYTISCRPMNYHKVEKEGDKIVAECNMGTYLGCTVSCRKPRAGEDWTRGNDLSDGKYCYETWQKIKNDIIAFELVKVVNPRECPADMPRIPETPKEMKEYPDMIRYPKSDEPVASSKNGYSLGA